MNQRIGVLPRNMLLDAELRVVARALAEADIPFIVLKGVPLTRRLHGRLDAREMVDNDILVHREQVLHAVRCLQGLGYQTRELRTPEGDLRTNFETGLYRMVGGARVWVDLHWTAFPPSMFSVRDELQWSRVESFQLGTAAVQVFDPAMTVIHLASHFAQHACSHPRVLKDLAAAWNKWQPQIDSEDLKQLASSTGVRAVLVLALNAAQELGWLAQPLPHLESRRAAWLRRVIPSQRLTSTDVFWYGRLLFTAALLPGAQPMSWLWWNAAPPIERLAVSHNERPSRWLYLRYPARPFRILRRLLTGHRRTTR